jgi:HK97 family phage major capsid protein
MNLTTNAASILKPEQVHELIVQPLTQESVAFQASTVARTTSHDYRIPTVTGDPDTNWVAEAAEIPLDDVDFGEVVVTPKKCAGLTVVSNELIQDSSPEATNIIGQRLVQSLKRKVDSAWFANTTANGPAGLGSITPTDVYVGVGGFTNVDPFYEALAAAEGVGAKLNAFVVNPDVALDLARLKEGTGSNKNLLQPDPTQPGRRVVAGVPLLVSPDAPVGVVWGIPKAVTFVVLRKDAEVALDSSPFFTSDRTAVRVTLRVGFGFAHEDAVVALRIADAP